MGARIFRQGGQKFLRRGLQLFFSRGDHRDPPPPVLTYGHYIMHNEMCQIIQGEVGATKFLQCSINTGWILVQDILVQ